MATNTQKKAQAHMAARDTRPSAHAKYVRISSRKVKIVIDLIRGKNVDDALAILKYTPKAASPVVYKLLSSAIANARPLFFRIRFPLPANVSLIIQHPPEKIQAEMNGNEEAKKVE